MKCPIRIKPEILQELEYHLLLLYTQTTRESANIIEEQRQNILEENKVAMEATRMLKEQAFLMKEALLKGELSRIGQILDLGWQFKKQVARGITNEFIDNIYKTAMDYGASGGKISGAGGGGFMTFYCPGNSRYTIASALHKQGVFIQKYNFVQNGLATWTSNQ